ECLVRGAREALVYCCLSTLEVCEREESIVIEHLLEVRDAPLRVGRVAMEASANVVVDAAGAHVLERGYRHSLRFCVGGPACHTKEESHRERRRELRCTLRATEGRVETLCCLEARRFQDGRQRKIAGWLWR